MFRRLSVASALLLSASPMPALAQHVGDADPWLWLEEIEGERALDQVRQWNAATEAELAESEGFAEDEARARAILDDEAQIAQPGTVMGSKITNFWRDAANPRGLWRIANLDEYVAGNPVWTTLIDVDALGKAEGQSWVWHGADCLGPEYRRCLISLSPGGTDADVVREYDLASGIFVDDGFVVPEAKSSVTWFDADRLMVATDYGAGSLTESGYPRIARLWQRGTPLESAEEIVSVDPAHVGLSAYSVDDGDTRWPMIGNAPTFWTREDWIGTPSGEFVKLPLSRTATLQGAVSGQLIVKLNEAEDGFPAGALVAYSIEDIVAGRKPVTELVMAPGASQAIEEVATTDNLLWVKALDDVSGRLFALRRADDGAWSYRAKALADNSTVHIVGTVGASDTVFATVEGMLEPPTLFAVGPGDEVTSVQSLPARFEASKMKVEQRFATSKDGTKIPYFLVTPKDLEGPVPALIHAYGGFRAAQTPTYLTAQPYRAGPLGLFWVEDGNAFVLANIRGGGEYGPAWHEAALREKRQNSFDDLHAVAEDLVAAGISAKGSIAISGRSNGGVLVGAAMNQRPDLYGAVISGSPLIDMQRYHKLLAGASWVGEYGDPDVAEDWAFMKLYSPYQNIVNGTRYPPVFFYSSTKDDRVHPGHARKTAAKLSAFGNTVYFHEYMEGGHSVGSDNAEDAHRAALLHAFLQRELMGEGE
ncbi:MAG: prolyl oligopeptidase family serine peptidase [Blastomonas sp.]